MRRTLLEWCARAEDDTLLRQWDTEKNGALSPSDVTPGTHRKVWWRCPADHEWRSEVKSRVKGSGCPVCSNRVVLPGFNDLATTHPQLAAEWHPTKNNGLTPADVVAGTERRVWWRCGNNAGHVWRAAVSSRVFEGCGCPVCMGRKVMPGENDLATQYPAIAAEWDTERNAPLTPARVMPGSNRKVHWICALGHRYTAAVSSRTAQKHGCPYCAGRRVLAGFNDLASREPKIAAQWYQPLNGALTPEMVTCGSRKKVYWRCGDGHVWQAVVSSRAGKQKCGCPVCAGQAKRAKLAYYDAVAPRRPRELYAAAEERAAP